jgi:hypothetical protein
VRELHYYAAGIVAGNVQYKNKTKITYEEKVAHLSRQGFKGIMKH